MKPLTATITALCLTAASAAQAASTQETLRMVAPALERYTQDTLLGDVWKRPGLSPRDRSIVTLAALIARNQTIELPFYLGLALDSGLRPREISEIITHLAFYSGWGNAMAAAAVAKDVFAARGIGSDQLPLASPPPLPLDEAAEAQRATRVGEQFGTVAPGVCSIRRMSCSETCGCAPTWRRATAAWSRSAPWSPPARSPRCPITSTGRWTTA